MPDYSSFGLKDKIAIVTGASQGIGRAIALGLAQAGAHVVLAKFPGPRMEEIEQVKHEIESLGPDSLRVYRFHFLCHDAWQHECAGAT